MADAKLLVFLHVAVKQRALQTELEGALPHIAVTAVGRVGDFDRAIKDGQDAVLTLPLVLAAHGLALALRGLRGGSPDEKYALVGADAPPDPARVAAVGVLDMLGREGMNTFVHGLLGGTPKVERVTKVEDLLPLLQMQRVQAVLLPARLFPEVKAASRMNLARNDLPAGVGLPALAVVGSGGPEVLAAVKKMPAAAARTLGVDQWR